MSNEILISCQQLKPRSPLFDYTGNGLDLDIQAGEIISIIGPDYTGKSDWLRTIAGIVQQQSGTLNLLGKNTTTYNKADWVHARKNLAYVKSDTAILSAANALQNVMLPARYHDTVASEQLAERAHKLLDAVGVNNLTNLPSYLRKDQCFKIAIARALILQPRALILDNPFMLLHAIDTETFQRFLLDQAIQCQMALIMVTHDVNFAIAHSNQIAFVLQNEILLFDKTNRIQRSENTTVQDYLNKNKVAC